MLRELTTNFEAFADIGAQIFKNAENLRRLDSDSDSLDLFFKLNQLKALKFNFVPNRVSIFSEDFTDQVKFRLEELFLDASEYMDEHVDVDGKQNVLAKFINLHQHYLKDLHIAVPIKSNHLKSILLNLKCLQKLYLAFQEDGLDLDPELIRQLKSSNSGVVDLNLRLNNGLVEETGVWDLQILEKFIECFPNVCALTLYFFSCNYEEKTFKASYKIMYLLFINFLFYSTLLQISNPKLKSIDVIFECKLKVIEHLELVELNNVNLSFWCPKTSPKQWRQFFSLNPNIRNLQIVECKFSNKCFRELTTLKELERLTIQSDLLIPSEITTYTEMVWKNCPNLIEMTLEPLITPDNVWILYSPEKEDETSDEDENLVVIP